MFLLNNDVILLRECFVGSSNEQGRKKENRKHPPKRIPIATKKMPKPLLAFNLAIHPLFASWSLLSLFFFFFLCFVYTFL